MPLVPCIVVSGKRDEELVVECMREGARDFVAKQRLVRLGPVVRREVQYARQAADSQRQQRAMEDALQRARRLEFVGQLSAGLAHNLNNILAALMGNLELALLETERERLERLLTRAVSACERAAKVVRQLHQMGYETVFEPQSVDLGALFRMVEELVAADKHPLIAQLAARNTELSKEVESLAGEIAAVEREERATNDEAQRIEEAFQATRKKIEVAGVSQILGQVLQEQRRSLPDLAKSRRKARSREGKTAETALSQILLGEERETLGPTPLSEVIEAQQEILLLIRDLMDKGEVAAAAGEETLV